MVKFLRKKLFSDFEDKRYTFNHKAEMHIITFPGKLDMAYDFYLKHNLCALERKLNAMTNKDKSLIDKLPRKWAHSLKRNFESHCVYFVKTLRFQEI